MLYSYLENIGPFDEEIVRKANQGIIDSIGLAGLVKRINSSPFSSSRVIAALTTKDSEIISAVVSHSLEECREEGKDESVQMAYWKNVPLIMPLLEWMGKEAGDMEKAIDFAYEAIIAISGSLPSQYLGHQIKGLRVSHGVDKLYLFVDRPNEAIDFELYTQRNPVSATRHAQEYLEGEAQQHAYQRIFDAIPRYTFSEFRLGLHVKEQVAAFLGDPQRIEQAKQELCEYLTPERLAEEARVQNVMRTRM